MGALLSQFMNRYGYTDFHELNADWMIRTMMELINQVENFVSLNAIKYADPIQWNITSQYEKNTIVIDPLSGTAYISVKPVPMGVVLTNTDYWTVVFDLGSFVVRAAKNFSNKYEAETTLTATFPSSVGDWLVWGDVLYEVISNIVAGDQYVVDSNIRHITMEEVCDALAQAITNLDSKVGDLDSLTTDVKTSVVDAIDSLVTKISEKPYVNVKHFGAVGDGVTNDTQAFIDAANSVGNNTPLFVPDGVYLVDTTLNLNNQIVIDSNAKIIDSNGLSMIIRPDTNDYNVAIANIQKYKGEFYCPPASAAITNIFEMTDNNSRISFAIVGSISANMNRITTADTSNIKLGDAIISTVDPIFNNTDPNSCMRVIEIGDNYIDFAPDKGDASGIGQTGYSYTGGALSGTFTIRPRYWSCPSFIGVKTGTEDNPDKVHWCGNDVAWTEGQRVIGREIDVLVMDDVNAECNGLLVTGQKWHNANVVGVNVQMGGNRNGNVAVSARNYDIGYFANAWTSFIFDSTYFDHVTNSNIPIAGGIIQSDYGEYISIRPSLALRQVVNGAVCVALRRTDDATPAGFLIRAMSADDLTQLFGVDVLGNGSFAGDLSMKDLNVYGNETVAGNSNITGTMTAGNVATGGNVTAVGDVTAANVGANGVIAQTVTATVAGFFKDIRIDQNATAGTITPNSYITLFDANNNPVQVPVYDPNI